MVRITHIVWDDWNIDHIARHGVTPEDVEEVLDSSFFITKGRDNTFRVIGQTYGGRYLTVYLATRGGGGFYVVTARDASTSERNSFRRS
jgi:uncharacterized DUF497 family protein